MIYKEINGDLFSADEKFYFAHCISSDYALGAGIAVLFNKKYDMKKKLKNIGSGTYPDCIKIDNVYNLVTKKFCWNKPTLGTLTESLKKMKEDIVKNNIKYLAMPKIGCGLDRLSWGNVSSIIKEIFEDVDIEINVYYLV
jgi:hypothetical protein